MTEWKNTSRRRTATNFSYQGSTKKYGRGTPAKQIVMIYGLLLYKRYLIKLVPFWLKCRLERANGGERFPRTWTAYWAYKLMPWPSWGMLTMAFRFVDEVIKPTLNREYGTICSSQIPVTPLIFGDDLQAHLNAIRTALGRQLLNLTKALPTKTWNASVMIVISLFCPRTTRTPPAQYNFSYDKKKPPQTTERK